MLQIDNIKLNPVWLLNVSCSLALDLGAFFHESRLFQMGEVRKLQKKLRQIENLEIKFSLTPEERFKVQKHTIPFPPSAIINLHIAVRRNNKSSSTLLPSS